MEISRVVNCPKVRENSSDLEEEQLVRAAQKGDREAFNQLVILYQGRIFNQALRILGDEDSAEDITQHAFLSAYHGLPSFRIGSFRSWMYRIVTNACYDELRRQKKRSTLSIGYEDEVEERLSPLPHFSNLNESPEHAYEKREFEQLIQLAFSRLSAEQRAVVVLIDLHDFDYRETANILGISIGTVKSRLARARLRLRYLLSKNLNNFN